MGIANFNRRFIKGFANITKPLTAILSDKIRFRWEKQQKAAFHNLKDAMCQAPSLGLPDWNRDFHIQTDASKIATGGMLFQID